MFKYTSLLHFASLLQPLRHLRLTLDATSPYTVEAFALASFAVSSTNSNLSLKLKTLMWEGKIGFCVVKLGLGGNVGHSL